MNVLQAWKLLKNKLLQSEMFEVGFSVKSSEVWCEIDIFSQDRITVNAISFLIYISQFTFKYHFIV